MHEPPRDRLGPVSAGAAATPEAELPVWGRVAVFGGVYSNHLALEAVLEDARRREVEAIVCLGDLGAFGPSPDRTCDRLRAAGIPVVRGNYDDSLARGLDDCQCGYTDPRDNHYARLSYQYTYRNTSAENRAWMAGLPHELRFRLGDLTVLGIHGSPRQMNEFLWESTTPTHFLQKLACDHSCDVILGTHTGLPWLRRWGPGGAGAPFAAGPGGYVNVGAIGRAPNDGRTDVPYAVLETRGAELQVEFVRVAYDHQALAAEMRREQLPEEFVETILTGWWTTCLEILPGRERARGRY